MDKKIAKLVARSLNNTAMGGKKSNYYHDDIWNLKYLPKFKWIHLTQQLAYERQQRQKQLQLEVTQAKTEMDMYMRNVEKAKMIQAMEEKKRKRQPHKESTEVKPQNLQEMGKLRRRFKQRKVVDDDLRNDMPSSKVSNLLSSILTWCAVGINSY